MVSLHPVISFFIGFAWWFFCLTTMRVVFDGSIGRKQLLTVMMIAVFNAALQEVTNYYLKKRQNKRQQAAFK